MNAQTIREVLKYEAKNSANNALAEFAATATDTELSRLRDLIVNNDTPAEAIDDFNNVASRHHY